MEHCSNEAEIVGMSKRAESLVVTRFKGKRRPTYIRQWRKSKNLTQEQLSSRAGMSVGNLSQIETGNYEYTQGALEALADALGCEPADLLMRNPMDPEAPWSIWERLKPGQRKTAIRLLRALADSAESAA